MCCFSIYLCCFSIYLCFFFQSIYVSIPIIYFIYLFIRNFCRRRYRTGSCIYSFVPSAPSRKGFRRGPKIFPEARSPEALHYSSCTFTRRPPLRALPPHRRPSSASCLLLPRLPLHLFLLFFLVCVLISLPLHHSHFYFFSCVRSLILMTFLFTFLLSFSTPAIIVIYFILQ